MMRTLMMAVTALIVMGLGYWAYMENYRTHAALREMRSIGRDIAFQTETLRMLRAEWAFLNRPDRLRGLVELNFDSLGLEALTSESFAEIEQIPFPPRIMARPDGLPSAGGVVEQGVLTSAVPGRQEQP